jgi:hypothetical protein
MDTGDLQAIARADDLPYVCAVVLAALAERDAGREVLNFNTLDVVLDCDLGTVLIQDALSSETPDLQATVGRFKDVATPLTDSQMISDAIARRRREPAERGVWPLPPAAD